VNYRATTNDTGFVRHGNDGALKGSPANRRYRRVLAKRPVRFVLPDGETRHGELIDASVRGLSVAAPRCALVGDEVELFVGDLGRLRGRIAGLHERGFGVQLATSKDQRVFLADALTVMLNPDLAEPRHVRFAKGDETVIETPAGDVGHCRIIDLSETGAQLSTTLIPDVSERVLVGRKRATVVRHFEGGVGITFTRGAPQKSE